ncbi:MAG TPA: hypothetical protein VMX58_02855 [Patescibacteria group bacterium]|nr:hypothetical protein [Patescibacteria group bacterium]
MTSYRADQRYVAVPATGFCHLIDREEEVRCLEAVRRNTKPGGVAIFYNPFLKTGLQPREEIAMLSEHAR